MKTPASAVAPTARCWGCSAGLKDASRASHVEEIRGEFIAIDRALAMLQPGDQCLVLVDQVQEALQHLARRVSEG